VEADDPTKTIEAFVWFCLLRSDRRLRAAITDALHLGEVPPITRIA
jgi:hypothetical protein